MHIISSSGNFPIPNTQLQDSAAKGLSSHQSESLSTRQESLEAKDELSSQHRLSNTKRASAATYEHLSKTSKALQHDFKSMRENMADLSNFAASNSEYESSYRTRVDQMDDAESVRQGRLMSLTIRTKEGDEIDFQIDRSIALESNRDGMMRVAETRISFSISGDLNEEEREALAELASKLGLLADTYLSNKDASMSDLLDLDQDALSGFSFDIKGVESSNFSAQYAEDDMAGTRSLSANLDDYTYELNTESGGLYLDPSLSDNEQYLAIRDLILDTAMDYEAGDSGVGKTSRDIARFFLDGMDALFLNADSVEDGEEDRASQGGGDISDKLHRNLGQEEGVLETFASGLPDFDADFNTPLLRPNEKAPGEVSTMGLKLSQSTETAHATQDGQRVDQIEQSIEYQSRISQHIDVAPDGEDVDYIYRTDRESGSLTRALTVLDSMVPVEITEKSEHEHLQTDKVVKDGNTISHDTIDLSREQENYDVKKLLPPLPTEGDLTESEMLDYLSIEGFENRTLGGRSPAL
jgi:hypothetical protein